MCGRVVSSSTPEEIARYFGAEAPQEQSVAPNSNSAPHDNFAPNYNVAPTSDILIVRSDGVGRHLAAAHWGLVPSWAKDLKVGNRMINARAETVATNNAYRRPFAKRRCIIPVDGFYEWAAVEGHRRKQPYFITRVDGEPLALAGLWEVWRGPVTAAGMAPVEDEETVLIRSCTIVTTSANATMAPVHNRMPVILPPSAWDEWLDPTNADIGALSALLTPAPERLLTLVPVSTDVGNVRNRGPELITPVAIIDPDGLHG